MNIEKFVPNVELNSVQSSVKITDKSPVVEIFSALTRGQDLSKFDGKMVDKVNAHIKDLSTRAMAGDSKAKVELNQITTIAIEAPLVKRLQLLKFMGDVINVGYNEEIRYRVYNIEGKKSAIQANSGDALFATNTFTTRTMSTQTITGGMAVNYREKLTIGDYTNFGILQEQTITDMYNKIFYTAMNTLYNGIKNATGIKNFAEASGLTLASVKAAQKIAKRWGNVSIVGDYSVVSQLNSMTGANGYTGQSNPVLVSEAAMVEIMKTGLLSYFNGSPVLELQNAFDLTKLNVGGTMYETVLPEGLLFFLANGTNSAFRCAFKGGLTSMMGTSVETGTELTRFDIEFGNVVIPEYIPQIGLVSDSAYAVDKG